MHVGRPLQVGHVTLSYDGLLLGGGAFPVFCFRRSLRPVQQQVRGAAVAVDATVSVLLRRCSDGIIGAGRRSQGQPRKVTGEVQ